MHPSTALFCVLLASVPALVNAAMCVGWFDEGALESVKKCCTAVSGDWSPVSEKEAACLFPNKDIDGWMHCAEPIMSNPDKLPYSLHAFQCSPCGDVCTITGGLTLTAPASKTPAPTSTLSPAIMYTPYPAAQEPVEEIK